MGIIRNLIEKRSWGAADDHWYSVLGSKTNSAVNVSEYSALNYTALYACVSLLARTMAITPCFLYKRKQDGSREVAGYHPAHKVIHESPNPEIKAPSKFKDTAQGHIGTWGNHYSFIAKNRMGQVQSLWPLNPAKTIKKRNMDTGELEYDYTDIKGQKQIFKNDQVLHIPGFGYDGLVGYNPISLLREAIGLGLSIEEFDARFYGHGMNPGGIITYPTSLKNEQRQDYKKEIQEKFGGLANSHGAMLLDGGSTYQSIGLPHDVSQTLETRMFQKQEMAMFYGVPPFMIGDTEKSTSWGTGIEQQTIGFITFSMLYWFTIWEEQLSASLLSPGEREDFYFEFNADALMRGDSTAKAAYYKNLWQIGGISINQIAKKENGEQVEGGDERFIPVNYMRLSDAGKNFNKTGNKDTKPINGDKNGKTGN